MGYVKIIILQIGFLRKVFQANHLASTDNLIRTINTYKCKLT